MVLCYNRLWKLLIDRGMTRTQMRLAAGMSTTTLAKLSKGEDVNESAGEGWNVQTYQCNFCGYGKGE